MARKPAQHERRATGDEGRPRVWRIARFGERFEMDREGYRRKGGLDYVRMFVSASTFQQSNESSEFLSQLDELGHYYPEHRHAYEGRFWCLLRLTATRDQWLRGYLLDSERRPLRDVQLAARLRLDTRTMKATLAALKRVRLLEYVEAPSFDLPPERIEDEHTDAEDEARSRKGGRQRTAKKGHKTGTAASIREDSGKSPKVPESLYEMTNGQSQAQSNGLAKGETQTNANPKGVGQTKTATAPTTAPPESQGPGPISPQEVTGGGPRHLSPGGTRKPATAPPRVHTGPTVVRLDRRACGDAEAIGNLLPRAHDGLTQGYTLRADRFADEIFDRLGPPFGREEREGQRELGNYRAALLDCVDSGMSPEAIEEMMACGRKDAEEIGRHRKRYYRGDGSPEQYWRFRWNKHFAARVPPARAGPAKAMG